MTYSEINDDCKKMGNRLGYPAENRGKKREVYFECEFFEKDHNSSSMAGS